MINEIVDLGKVSDPLASVFIMNVSYLNYIKIDIDENFIANVSIDSFYNKEEVLKAGVFRGKSGNKIILVPGSFVLEVEKDKIKTRLDFFKNGLEYIKSEFLNKIFDVIQRNFDEIASFGLEIAGDMKKNETKRVAVCVYYQSKPIYEYKNLLEKLKEVKISLYFDEYGKKGICNVLGIEDKLYYPKANFYYPFSTDKKIVKFDLKDDKNLFLISKKAILYFFAGKEYIENFNRYKVLGHLAYITASSFELQNIKTFQKLIVKSEDERNLKNLIHLFKSVGAKLKYKILINFYFHTSPVQGSKEIISYVKDVMPTHLVEIDKKFEMLSIDFSDYFYQDTRYFTTILSSILEGEKNKRELIEHFSKIVLNKPIDFKRIVFLINQKSEQIIAHRKDNRRFDLYYYLFVIWLKGEDVKEIEESNYEERLEYVLNHFELIKQSDSAKVGLCLGLILKMLSFSINDYDKKILAFVSKKVGRDKKSLLSFVNPIFAKAKLHQKSNVVDINISCATKYIAQIGEFDKEEFIFGMFLGNELYNKIKKGEEDE